ncbi:phosphotransferase family protein [Dactylosporangium sp. NPDC049525]|uniref:phosphotransferase family protein n=1 Tax=Dactylosporangium sp. NPDC049525 TaxID=3154730 RepID=UPI00342039E3
MAVAVTRDPELTRTALTGWLSARFAAPDLRLGPVTVPPSTGFSAENLVVDATWTGADGPVRRRLVVRVAPTTYQLHPRPRFWLQYHIQRLLGERTSLPVAPVHGFEPDPGLLGAPFCVLGHVAGTVPADLPSYHREGWLHDAPQPLRAAAWRHAVDALADIHRLDPATLGLAAQLGPADLAAQVEELAADLDFYGCAENPQIRAGIDLLRATVPTAHGRPALLWGDARLGNLVFDGATVAAVLDWELAGHGAPETDLAWFLHLDRHLSEGIGAERLPGLPDTAATVARWARRTGRMPHALDFHRVLAAVRFAAFTARVTTLATGHGLVPADFPLHRNATRLLAATLKEVGT